MNSEVMVPLKSANMTGLVKPAKMESCKRGFVELYMCQDPRSATMNI
jgi:hypothetical protein